MFVAFAWESEDEVCADVNASLFGLRHSMLGIGKRMASVYVVERGVESGLYAVLYGYIFMCGNIGQ
jgi:hypothetical protein